MMSLSLFPANPSLSAYKRVFANRLIYSGFRNTLFRVAFGTSITMVLTLMTAFPLSKKSFPDRSLWTGLLVFTMFFGGGLIPGYLLIRSLRMTDTIWALVLPGAISTYNMIIMRNFFMSLPAEIEDSARLDGAGEAVILIRIVVPLSGAIIATIALWTVVGHWNAWFDSMIYMSNSSRYVLQHILRQIVIEGTASAIEMNNFFLRDPTMESTPDAVKAATIMVATLPILAAYPFLQKYFVKGIMIGSLKG
jgi:putative aldouronate transport system permease protein